MIGPCSKSICALTHIWQNIFCSAQAGTARTAVLNLK
jgi:hypothetical protein